MRYLYCGLAASLAVLLLATSSPAALRRAGRGPFGSAKLLHTLWSPRQLAGTPADRRQGPFTPPDLAPPRCPRPQHTLPSLAIRNEGAVRCVRLPRGEKLVALTFDLCELSDRVSGYNNTLVNFLRQGGIRATFFAGGRWMRSHPQKAEQLMADPLFEVGNHAWTHGNLGVLHGRRVVEQIEWTQSEYELLRAQLAGCAAKAGLAAQMASVPPVPVLFRLPYGRADRESLRTLARLGLRVIQWSVVGEEFGGPVQVPAEVHEVLRQVRPGAILLFHANCVPHNTARVIPALVRDLQRRGYHFVTVSDLLAAGTPVASRRCYFRHPGDNLFLDRVYGDGTRHLHRHR